MSKEEIASIVLYCKENNVSFKDRLKELRIAPWRFNAAKSKYSKEVKDELLAIGNKGRFIACPDLTLPKSVFMRRKVQHLCTVT